ncbi:hypothetical protein F4777DRAFT_134547 [Nemania sp. FL0916]|nr:hypothetical protein F4777DRAFT_134547 [Nemania sp. FL0916]
MADSPERTSCLSAEPHENNITDPLLHFLGCIKISKRHDFLEENFPGWKEEAGEYHKDPSSQHLPKAANQLAIHWATRIQNEMRRIALLRHTLSMDNRDKHLVQEMGESGEIWRGENKLNRGANSNTGPDFPRSTEEYVPEKDALVLVIQFQNSKGFTDPDQRLSGEFPNQTTTIDKLLDESNPEENLLYKDRESDSNHIKYFHIPSNNMTWVEEAIARYHVGRKSNSFKKSNDIVIDMQCLHWEAPRTQEQLVREIDKIIQSSRVQPERVVENAMPNKTKWNRYNRNALGRYLLAAAHLYQGMKTYRDGTLLYEYYLKQSAVYTSRTLEKASSSLFKSIKKTNASGAIQKGTATTSDTFHRYDEDTKDLLEHKGLSNEKMFQVIMEDQLRVWVLNGKSLITYFSRRYGTDTQDSLEVPKSISTYLEQISTDKAQIRTVFELALIVFNKYIEIPFKGGRLSNTQPRTGNTFFYEELDIVLNILNAQEDVVRSFAEEAERVLDPDGSFCAIFVRTALAKKDPLELGKGYGDYRSFKLRASECRETIESQRKEINLLREDAINTGDKVTIPFASFLVLAISELTTG